MGFITSKIAKQVAQIGEPKTTTQTTTVEQEDEQINFGNLMLMALMLLEDKAKTSVGVTPTPPANPVPDNVQAGAPGSFPEGPAFTPSLTTPSYGVKAMAPSMAPSSFGDMTPQQLMTFLSGMF